MTDEERLAQLRAEFDALGGRGVDLADEIDQLACKLGDCHYSDEECFWKEPASHPDADGEES